MNDRLEITQEMFDKAENNFEHAETISKPSVTYWADAWRRLKENKLAMAGLMIIGVLFFFAIVGPYISRFAHGHTYDAQIFERKNIGPNSINWFGTDTMGRDLWTRAWYGGRISLTIGLVATLMEFIIGSLYGGIAGSVGGKTDNIMMRLAEVLYSIPYLLIVILMSIVLGQGLIPMITAMVITGWLGMSRLVRGQVLQLKEQDYVQASTALGGDVWWRLKKHLIPNTMGPILVNMTLSVPSAIFAEATLSFLGLGVPAPMASWGSMAKDGLESLLIGQGYQLFVPAFLISLTMFAFNVLGDGLRDALDPQLRK